MAMVRKKWMQKASERMERKGTTGTFSAAAKRAGMSTLAYANKILRAHKGRYSAVLRKRANFAKNAIESK